MLALAKRPACRFGHIGRAGYFVTFLTVLACQAAVDSANWMKALSDSTQLTSLSIPDSHDTCALHEWLPGTARCQNLRVQDQLNLGVRFVDIRCRIVCEELLIYHGIVYQETSLKNVVEEMLQFLNTHQGECIIISIKNEAELACNRAKFESLVERQISQAPKRWYIDSSLADLGHVRSKLVFFRRYYSQKVGAGINANPWRDNTCFGVTNDARMVIQDVYCFCNRQKKWEAIEAMYSLAQHSGEEGCLYLNFARCDGPRA